MQGFTVLPRRVRIRQPGKQPGMRSEEGDQVSTRLEGREQPGPRPNVIGMRFHETSIAAQTMAGITQGGFLPGTNTHKATNKHRYTILESSAAMLDGAETVRRLDKHI